MTKDTLPTYAIVELLIRLAQLNPHIGDYKGHSTSADNDIVKTTNGKIPLLITLIWQQFEQPDLITEADLKQVILAFQPLNTVRKKRQ